MKQIILLLLCKEYFALNWSADAGLLYLKVFYLLNYLFYPHLFLYYKKLINIAHALKFVEVMDKTFKLSFSYNMLINNCRNIKLVNKQTCLSNF